MVSETKGERQKVAIIIGAGPAGLTAALELIRKTSIKPIIFEATEDVGGISKTVKYHGNRMDIGGHRFFSKSKKVTDWWLEIMPLQGVPSRDDRVLNRPLNLSVLDNTCDPEKVDALFLLRRRLSRIYFLKKFFDYPVGLSWNTIRNLGLKRLIKIFFGYVRARVRPIKPEESLQDFFINRFGVELYRTFFKDYTEKVWGVPCDKIDPSWGVQRIKGLSITKALLHALKKIFSPQKLTAGAVETSLIEQFYYPKFGPGQLWEEVAKKIIAGGGEIHFNSPVSGVKIIHNHASAVLIKNSGGVVCEFAADFVFSTMAVKDLVNGIIGDEVPTEAKAIASGLVYRDFMTVGLLLDRLKISNNTGYPTINNIVPDNWIYIQEREVKLGRLQIFNNWSPYLVSDPRKIWIGLEYFCQEGDEMWTSPDQKFIDFATSELESIGIISQEKVLDAVLIRCPKAYPAYFGSYNDFYKVRNYLDGISNLFLIGRNGMHRYNNQDHSMLTAMQAVDNIVAGIKTKDNIWSVNAEQEYHEEKK